MIRQFVIANIAMVISLSVICPYIQLMLITGSKLPSCWAYAVLGQSFMVSHYSSLVFAQVSLSMAELSLYILLSLYMIPCRTIDISNTKHTKKITCNFYNYRKM